MDEQTQLQIALSISKEEAKKVKVYWQRGILLLSPVALYTDID